MDGLLSAGLYTIYIQLAALYMHAEYNWEVNFIYGVHIGFCCCGSGYLADDVCITSLVTSFRMEKMIINFRMN